METREMGLVIPVGFLAHGVQPTTLQHA